MRATAYERQETFSLPSSGSLGKNIFSLQRDHARAMNELAGVGTFVSFAFRFCFLMFVYQAKIIQYCFYHKPLKNSTVLHSPLTRQISTVYAQNRPQVETVSHCTYPSRVESLQYIRRPSSYKPHQLLSSFPACLAKHPFLPEICTLRQVANELCGYIYSALAIYFYAVIYLHHEDIDGHLLRLYNI